MRCEDRELRVDQAKRLKKQTSRAAVPELDVDWEERRRQKMSELQPCIEEAFQRKQYLPTLTGDSIPTF